MDISQNLHDEILIFLFHQKNILHQLLTFLVSQKSDLKRLLYIRLKFESPNYELQRHFELVYNYIINYTFNCQRLNIFVIQIQFQAELNITDDPVHTISSFQPILIISELNILFNLLFKLNIHHYLIQRPCNSLTYHLYNQIN